MELPDNAHFEVKIAPGVHLMNIQHILPVHARKVYRQRKRDITTLFVHHSGFDNGLDGLGAVKPMANWHVKHRGWAGIGYHYVITRRPVTSNSKLVILRVGAEYTIRAHTRGCNRFGVGLCLQGHLGKEELTSFQEECLEAFIPWWMEWHNRTPRKDLGWHSNSWKWGGIPKPACPGKHARRWLKGYQDNC